MSDTDIVTWLRSILHNDRSVELRCQEAANEIERLREELTAAHESHGNEVGALTERLSLAIHERDEARRIVCFKEAADLSFSNGIPYHRSVAHKIAKEYGWDCFKKENANGKQK